MSSASIGTKGGFVAGKVASSGEMHHVGHPSMPVSLRRIIQVF